MSARKPDPTPYVSNEVRLITIGTIAWAAAGVVFAIIGAKADRLWMSLAGTVFGINGIRIAMKRRKRQVA